MTKNKFSGAIVVMAGSLASGLVSVSAFAETASGEATASQKSVHSPTNAGDQGAKGDGISDDGPQIGRALNAAGAGGITVIPHTEKSYRISSGHFAGGQYPSSAWSWPDRTDVYSAPGIVVLGNNRFHGTAIGDPESCSGKLTNPYTQTCLTATDYKIVMDPASIWAGPRTTNVGMTIGCLPNHRNPNEANRTDEGYRRNWIACMYAEVDTGQDGQSHANGTGFGSDISTEFVNGTLSVGSNHGTFREINVNVYGTVKDGGITRSDFILSSCGPFANGIYSGGMSCQASVRAGKSPWGVTSEFANAIEIGATPFSAPSAPAPQTNGHGEIVYRSDGRGFLIYPRWTNGILAYGAVNNFVAQGSVDGESGYSFQARTAKGDVQFSVDKAAGNVTTAGSIMAGSNLGAHGAIQINGTAGSYRFIHVDTAGRSRWEVGGNDERETGANAGTDFYISRRSDTGAANGVPLSISRATGIVKIESALRLPAYSVSSLPKCDAAYTGVLAYVSDARIVSYNTAPVGGGAHRVPVFCDGADWTIH